jgi:hypothetical protein
MELCQTFSASKKSLDGKMLEPYKQNYQVANKTPLKITIVTVPAKPKTKTARMM